MFTTHLNAKALLVRVQKEMRGPSYWKLEEKGLCYILAENLSEFCTVVSKAGFTSNELEH
jgi:hypothetical protein